MAEIEIALLFALIMVLICIKKSYDNYKDEIEINDMIYLGRKKYLERKLKELEEEEKK